MNPAFYAFAKYSAVALVVTVLSMVSASVLALNGRFEATVDGLPTTIELQTQAGQVHGLYLEGALQLRLQGRIDGAHLQATLIEPNTGLQIAELSASVERDAFNAQIDARNPLSGASASTRARFTRIGAAASATAPASSGPSGALDPALIGTWVNEENINSGGASFASFSTRMRLLLKADGSVEQWTQSVGGGADWSYGGGGPTLQYQGRWQSADGVLQVQLQGMDRFQPAARYRFSGDYLVTEQDSGRRIWQRGR